MQKRKKEDVPILTHPHSLVTILTCDFSLFTYGEEVSIFSNA